MQNFGLKGLRIERLVGKSMRKERGVEKQTFLLDNCQRKRAFRQLCLTLGKDDKMHNYEYL